MNDELMQRRHDLIVRPQCNAFSTLVLTQCGLATDR
jgi:hypothetical protein